MKKIGFFRLFIRSLPEIWFCQVVIGAPIFLCEAIQKQEKTGVFSVIKKSIKALPRFFTPSGFLILLYILFITPLIGIGFSLSITESLYVPRFITEVIEKNTTLNREMPAT
ncbi:MAG: glycerophosphoryl diester phosphodiesterase membrane domain-containing protein [Lachnospiraceae bacterium]|nr:glycerophosphoryl diester phosphodiesterase membrane domain-containing protein [Lachnospiraceae bacterium]